MSRLGIVALAVVLIAGGAYGLHKLFTSRDNSAVGGSGAPSTATARGGNCPAKTAEIPRDGGTLTTDQIRTALARGNVVLLAPAPEQLRALQKDVSGRFDAEIAAAGQMVVLAHGTKPVIRALAWGRETQAQSPSDPALRDFAEAWLGQGAGTKCPT